MKIQSGNEKNKIQENRDAVSEELILVPRLCFYFTLVYLDRIPHTLTHIQVKNKKKGIKKKWSDMHNNAYLSLKLICCHFFGGERRSVGSEKRRERENGLIF